VRTTPLSRLARHLAREHAGQSASRLQTQPAHVQPLAQGQCSRPHRLRGQSERDAQKIARHRTRSTLDHGLRVLPAPAAQQTVAVEACQHAAAADRLRSHRGLQSSGPEIACNLAALFYVGGAQGLTAVAQGRQVCFTEPPIARRRRWSDALRGRCRPRGQSARSEARSCGVGGRAVSTSASLAASVLRALWGWRAAFSSRAIPGRSAAIKDARSST